MALNSRVVTLQAVDEAFFDAWFNSRRYFYEVCSSAQESADRLAASTSFGTELPVFSEPSGGYWVNQTAWLLNFYALGTLIQAFVLGVGHRQLWVDHLDQHRLTRPSGPFGVLSFGEDFRARIAAKALGQGKSRKSGIWKSQSGERNRLLLRVPHR